MVVPVGVTLIVCGLVAFNTGVCVVPLLYVKLNSGAPVKVTVKVAFPPLQIVVVPLNVAVGRAFIVALTSPMSEIQPSGVSTLK